MNDPQSVFDDIDREFQFTLDVCSTDENAKCAKANAGDKKL